MVKSNQMKPQKKGRVPLERALSKLGLFSRAEAAQMIASGLVKVHGTIETNPLRMVNPDSAHIEIQGKKAARSDTLLVIFHKPKGVVTTKRDPEGRKTIYDFLPDEYQNLHAVGRLDMHTTGLLLLTNDTKLSHFLTDPENEVPRIYIAKITGELSGDSIAKMSAGVLDEGELLQADEVKIIKASGKESTLELTLTQGKNREIRRLCLALGHEVVGLKRIRYGVHELGELQPGEYRLAVIN